MNASHDTTFWSAKVGVVST